MQTCGCESEYEEDSALFSSVGTLWLLRDSCEHKRQRVISKLQKRCREYCEGSQGIFQSQMPWRVSSVHTRRKESHPLGVAIPRDPELSGCPTIITTTGYS